MSDFPKKLLRRFLRRSLALAGLGLMTGCEMLPIATQTKMAAAQLKIPNEEITAVAQRASTGHRLEVMWVKKIAGGAIEVGLGNITPRIAIVFRRIDGRWVEDWKSETDWSTPPDLGMPPPPPSY